MEKFLNIYIKIYHIPKVNPSLTALIVIPGLCSLKVAHERRLGPFCLFMVT